MGLTPNEMVEILRLRNHDCLNHLQVIVGYLQLERSPDALGYLRKTVQILQEQNSVLKWVYPQAALLILKIQMELMEIGISLSIENETDLQDISISQEQLKDLLMLLFKFSDGKLLKDSLVNLAANEEGDFYAFQVRWQFKNDDDGQIIPLTTIKKEAEAMGCVVDISLAGDEGYLVVKCPKKANGSVET